MMIDHHSVVDFIKLTSFTIKLLMFINSAYTLS